ncbi:MAG: hypothetical protein WBN85_02425 [Candidatus Macondimonas sp.]
MNPEAVIMVVPIGLIALRVWWVCQQPGAKKDGLALLRMFCLSVALLVSAAWFEEFLYDHSFPEWMVGIVFIPACISALLTFGYATLLLKAGPILGGRDER